MSNGRKTLARLIVMIGLLVIISVLAAGPILAQSGLSRQRLEWAIAKRLLVTGISAFDGAATFNSTATFAGATTLQDDASVAGGLSVTGNITPSGNIANRALYVRLQDVANDAGNNVLTATAVATTTSAVTSTNLTQPDYPRNLIISYQRTTTETTGTLTIAGVDAQGNSASEDLTTNAGAAGTQAITGSVPFATISSLTLPTRSGAITLTVGLGEKFGLPLIPQASGDVFFFTKNNAYTSSFTVDTTYGTVLPTADVAANDDYTIGVKQ